MKQPWPAIGMLVAALVIVAGFFLLKKQPPAPQSSPQANTPQAKALPEFSFETDAEKNQRTDALNAQVSRSLRFDQSQAKLVNDPRDRSQLSEDALLLDNPEVTEDQAQTALYSLLGSLKMVANGGSFPAGLNVEITNALLGVNQRKIGFLPMDCPRINENGELVDQYGTGYWFHSKNAQAITITSAGLDKTFHTADDITYPRD